MEIDCNIDEFEGKRKAVAALKATSETPTTFKLVVPKEHARMRLVDEIEGKQSVAVLPSPDGK